MINALKRQALFRGFYDCLKRYKHTLHTKKTLNKIAKRYSEFDHIVMTDRAEGLFSIFFQALPAYYIATRNKQKIYFLFKNAPYYSDKRDELSWWDYYYNMSESVHYEKSHNQHKTVLINDTQTLEEFSYLGRSFPRQLAFKICQNFPLNDECSKIVDDFVRKNFKGSRVVGIHYRGTDKVDGSRNESTRVGYSNIIEIVKYLNDSLDDVVYFVATDENNFINALTQTNANVIYTNSYRSSDGTPIHYCGDGVPPDIKGQEAIIDCHLLARTNFLIRTSSNLSKACEFLNPKLEVIEISPSSAPIEIAQTVKERLKFI